MTVQQHHVIPVKVFSGYRRIGPSSECELTCISLLGADRHIKARIVYAYYLLFRYIQMTKFMSTNFIFYGE